MFQILYSCEKILLTLEFHIFVLCKPHSEGNNQAIKGARSWQIMSASHRNVTCRLRHIRFFLTIVLLCSSFTPENFTYYGYLFPHYAQCLRKKHTVNNSRHARSTSVGCTLTVLRCLQSGQQGLHLCVCGRTTRSIRAWTCVTKCCHLHCRLSL